MAKRVSHTLELKVNDAVVPIKIYEEWRTTVRISINNRYASLRMPSYLPSIEKINQTERAKKWVIDQIGSRKRLYNNFKIREYKDGSNYTFRGIEYVLSKKYEDRKTSVCKISNNTIYLKINKSLSASEESKAIASLLSRSFAAFYLPEIEGRVNNLNNMYFQSKIGSVKLKYNKSNWGSCSSRGNINLSTRLLFAPDEVIDYVIIHELAHTKEMNHSAKFWKHVSDACPDYKSAERWLKVNNHLCDY